VFSYTHLVMGQGAYKFRYNPLLSRCWKDINWSGFKKKVQFWSWSQRKDALIYYTTGRADRWSCGSDTLPMSRSAWFLWGQCLSLKERIVNFSRISCSINFWEETWWNETAIIQGFAQPVMTAVLVTQISLLIPCKWSVMAQSYSQWDWSFRDSLAVLSPGLDVQLCSETFVRTSSIPNQLSGRQDFAPKPMALLAIL